MKDAVLNLLVFVLGFLAVAALFLVFYSLTLGLVPGGRGLVFASPYAAALFPGLLGGLFLAQFRAVRYPGRFVLTWLALAAGFFLILTLSLPVIQALPPVRAADAAPLVPGRFLKLDDGSSLLAPFSRSGVAGPTVTLPPGAQPMVVATDTQYDPLNQRFVFSVGEPRGLAPLGPEQRYFGYPAGILSMQTDLLALVTVLKTSLAQQPAVFWVQAAAITWLFMGFLFFFSLRTWRLALLVILLLAARLALVFLTYAFWGVPALIDQWLSGPWADLLRLWAPLILVLSVASSLFFMTWLSKPHLTEPLT